MLSSKPAFIKTLFRLVYRYRKTNSMPIYTHLAIYLFKYYMDDGCKNTFKEKKINNVNVKYTIPNIR